MSKSIYMYILGLCLVCLGACSPKDDYYNEVDYSLMGYVLSDNSDNFNISSFGALMRRGGLDKVLLEPGPFTAFVPSNTVLGEPETIYGYSAVAASNLANYHVLNGEFELEKLPYLFNQEIKTRGGNPVYVTHWINEQGVGGVDTIITVNGARVSPVRIDCSNGIAYVINKALSPNVYANVWDAIADEEDITLFSHAVFRTGLDQLISQGEGVYTVFAPSNTAMAAHGFTSVQSVEQADIDVLTELVKYHILPDRRFINDFALTIPLNDGQVVISDPFIGNIYGTAGRQYGRMLNGNTLTFRVQYYPLFNWHMLELIDMTNTSMLVSSLLTGGKSDIMANNGVLHVIDGVLKTEN
ncbi:fasciclin domain-containing protein [Sphingobacterium sp. LRF_L2]|uniref:fasciclin domain-containing protein n=1 Tax=Sphingobacterium sp. LRF_L2 TaxID=3369421 RepID=UPI003F61785B